MVCYNNATTISAIFQVTTENNRVELASCADWIDSDSEIDGDSRSVTAESGSSGQRCCNCGGANPPPKSAVSV